MDILYHLLFQACDILYLMSMLAGCFGLDQWHIILRENYEVNRQREVEIAQEEAELSESLFVCLFFQITNYFIKFYTSIAIIAKAL